MSEQHHYMPRELPDGEKTSALWAMKPHRKLILFVHGFGGGSTKTWLQFPALLPQSEKAKHADIIFYGYDSLKTRAYISGLALMKFLIRTMSDSAGVVNSTLLPSEPRRDASFTWDEVVICAHSLGSVVSRQAVLGAHKRKDPWASKIKLVFFAPAHTGADILKLAAEALSGLPGLIPAMAKTHFQVLLDLEPTSDMLKYLREQVEKELPNAPFLSARAVFLAGDDKVVSPLPFFGDPDPPTDFFPGRSHTEICKPTSKFPEPLTSLEKVL